jgi:WD40 repeat protein
LPPTPAPTETALPTMTPEPPQPGLSLLRSLRGSQKRVTGLDFTPDGQGLASASDELIRVWDPATGELLNAFDSGATIVSDAYDVAYSPDGLLLATGSGDEHLVKIRRASDGDELARFVGHADTVDFVIFSPDGARLASGSYADNSVRLWQVSDGTQVWVADVLYPRAIAFAPDGSIVTIARNDGVVELRNADTGALLRELSGHLAGVDSMDFSADGTLLATGAFDGDIRIWDMATGETLAILSGAGDTVRGVAWSPDASLIVAGSVDGYLRLYDVVEERLLSELAVGEVTSMALSSDGSLVAVGVWVMEQGASVHIVSTKQ